MPIRKTTILTADDDPQLLRLIARNLELEDYQVLVASDGQQALEQIEQHAPDLVLLDVMMPRMDGFTVCQRVREFSAVPIIIVTARGQDQDKVRGLDLGADDYLTKPFSIEELLARVRAVLRRAHFSASEQAHTMHPTTTIGELSIEYAQHLLHVVDVPPAYGKFRSQTYFPDSLRNEVRQEAETYVKAVADRLLAGPLAKSQLTVTSGVYLSTDVAGAIIKLAEHAENAEHTDGYDLIAMATHAAR